jgi:hypothetical protein
MNLVSLRYLYWLGVVLTLVGCTANQDPTKSTSTASDSVEVESESQPNGTTEAVGDSQNTSNRISEIQDRLIPIQTPDSDSASEQRYQLDVVPFNRFLNEAGYLDLVGKKMSEIDEVLGEAPVVVRQSIKGAPMRKEIRVYFPYQEDSTGLYIFFENETIVEFKMDEFNGIIQSGILDYMS